MWIHKNNHSFSYHSIVITKTFLERKQMVFSCIVEPRTKNNPGFHKFMDGEADRMRRDVQEYLGALLVVSEIVVGGIGAVPTTDTDGYYLVEFTCEPYECKESHQLIVEGKYSNPVKRAGYTRSDLFDKHVVNHIVHAAVTMDPIFLKISNSLVGSLVVV